MHSVGREDKMEQQNLQDNTDIEIDVLELFHVLLNKFWIILLAGIIAGLAFIGGTILFITPQYESTTIFFRSSSCVRSRFNCAITPSVTVRLLISSA